MYLKSVTTAHLQIMITHDYILYANVLTWYEVETTKSLINEVGQSTHQPVHVTFSKTVFLSVNCAMFLPNLSHSF